MDLCVLTLDRWPGTRQTLRVYRNGLANPGNWIGFHLRDSPRRPVAGAVVTVRYGEEKTLRPSVTGDGFRTQQSTLIHFGLGRNEQVDGAEIRWPDGQALKMDHPAINRYHELSWPGEAERSQRNADQR